MKIVYKKIFQKQLRRLWVKVKQKFDSKIEKFLLNKYDKQLNNHSLKGKYQWMRSITITWDIRALYYEEWDTIVIFVFIGSHSELY